MATKKKKPVEKKTKKKKKKKKKGTDKDQVIGVIKKIRRRRGQCPTITKLFYVKVKPCKRGHNALGQAMNEFKRLVRAATSTSGDPWNEAKTWMQNDEDCGKGCIRQSGMIIGPYQSIPDADPDSRTKPVCVSGIAGIVALKTCKPA